MKKLFYYGLLMVVVVVILPLLIVGSCSPVEEPEPSKEEIRSEVKTKIKVYDAVTAKIQEMDLEEYLKGVVAAEMPADFELEALKAQAVAARSFTWGRLTGVFTSKPGVHDGADICTDPAHCQAWKSKEKAVKSWGIFFGKRNWSKIEKAVGETRGIIAVYNGKVANTLFHSNSGGRTEDAAYVWAGVSVPYLQSVPSLGEESTREYKNTVLVKNTDFVRKFLETYPGAKINAKDVFGSIKINNYTRGGRVWNMKVGDTAIKGTDLRKILDLKSANFKIERADSKTLRITTQGYGHGVGMSQWGANYLAKRGGAYDEILRYYYTGITLSNINNP